MQTIAEQLNAELFTTIEGMDFSGASFDISIPTASINTARLERSLDILMLDIEDMNTSYDILRKAGERDRDTQVWGVVYHDEVANRDHLLCDTLDSKEQADAAIMELSEYVEDTGGAGVALQIMTHCEAIMLKELPRSRWLARLTHRINARIEQYNQTVQLLEAING